MPFKEFIDRKSTHIVLAIIAINVAVWVSWSIFKPASKSLTSNKPEISRMEDMSGPSEKRSYSRSEKGTPKYNKAQSRLDSLKNAATFENKRRLALKNAVESSANTKYEIANPHDYNKSVPMVSPKDKYAKSTATYNSMQKEIDSLKTAIAIMEKPTTIATEQKHPVTQDTLTKQSATQSSVQFVFDNWTTIFSIITAVPVIVLKWEQAIETLKGKKNKKVAHKKK